MAGPCQEVDEPISQDEGIKMRTRPPKPMFGHLRSILLAPEEVVKFRSGESGFEL